ncbi:MAG TPA: histidine phosphatase family protein [Xanthobacteraceae bacterium]|nr:histidine phosphatase family protein [Xanthobacteraceae bacterium]
MAAMVCAVQGWSAPAAAGDLSGGPMLDELKHGGYVIYLRHDRTDLSRSDTDPINLRDCTTQRPLSNAGRAHAKKIGEVLRTMGIRIGAVYASPVCRATETAELVFPGVELTMPHAMIYTLALPKEELAAAAAELRKMLATPPAGGANTVLVGHTTNLQEAAGVWPKKEGGALIFRPDGHGAFTLAGAVDPDDFERSAE